MLPFKRGAALAAVSAGAVLLIPADDALAAGHGPVTAPAALDPLVRIAKHAHDRAVSRHVRLHRRNAELRGRAGDPDRRRAVRDWSLDHLRSANRDLARANRRLLRRAAGRAAAERAAERAAAGQAAASTEAAAAAAARQGPTQAAAPAPAAPASGGLQSIAACESGGAPSAVDPSGTYRGKYQFDQQTWTSVGGSGDPAAAPEAEQDRRAAALYAQRGASAWPSCGG